MRGQGDEWGTGAWCDPHNESIKSYKKNRTEGEDLVVTFPPCLSSSNLGEAGPATEPHEVTGDTLSGSPLPYPYPGSLPV